MQIENARWVDPDKTSIMATIDGQYMAVPVDLGNRHYQEIIRQGVEIAPAPPGRF